MILVSHLADEVIGLTDWAIRLEEGRVVARGPSVSILRESETQVDNYFTGTVVAPGHVWVGSTDLSAVLPDSATGAIRLACYAHDILLATRQPEQISARNVIRTRVTSIEGSGAAVLVGLEEPHLRALLTAGAINSLALKPGSEVFAILKATSIAYLGRL